MIHTKDIVHELPALVLSGRAPGVDRNVSKVRPDICPEILLLIVFTGERSSGFVHAINDRVLQLQNAMLVSKKGESRQ